MTAFYGKYGDQPTLANREKLRSQMLRFYSPLPYGSVTWTLNLFDLPKNAFDGCYRFLAFAELSDDAARVADEHSPNFLGEMSVFARAMALGRCANCVDQQRGGALIQGSIDLTAGLERMGLAGPERPTAVKPSTIL